MKSRVSLVLGFAVALLVTLLRADAGHHEAASIPITVVRISKEYKNINTSISDTTLTTHGIVHGKRFDVRFREHHVTPLLGKEYTDVPRGDWVALIETDHMLQIAISYGHAAEKMGCTVGDTLYISPRK